ncbi:DNA-binding protein [Kaistia sp. 32K]|uniref:RNA-binding protein n=1 Tax=Kaistia sp. 32K TaxID=2795690 RepID=UPI001914E216|nr:RNA-binding protein [Kaistia sp. 32K]BCP55880.1 DNA-binding protein [Kaistia sp. 32K]
MPRKSEPTTRSCIVSRETMPPEKLIRFVLDPEGQVVPDLRHRLPGRGVWVTARADMVALAEKKRLFSRGFKEEVKVEPGLAGRVEKLLEDSALQAVSFARKAGEIVTGFAKVETAIARDAVAGIVQAQEAGDDGRQKIDAALKRRFGRANAVPVIRIFRSEQLDLALGRSNVIHAALLAGRASENVLERVAALACFLGEDGLVAIGDDVGAIDAPQVRDTNVSAMAEDPAGQKTE